MLVLGIDTSCDDTSCAVVEDGWRAISNIVSSQVNLHAKYGGVVPEIASRRHLEMISPAVDEALATAGVTRQGIDAVAVTAGPGLLGSLLVGLCFGKSLAAGLGIPLAGVNHLEGHIYANFLREAPPEFPLLNLVVSGGHSDLILMRGHGSYELLGETRDDAAGEVFDKVARELGLPFPGGPNLDRAADDGDAGFLSFAHPKMDGNRLDFSFSGMKTRALQALDAARPRGCDRERDRDRLAGVQARGGSSIVNDISASLREAIVRDLLYHVPALVNTTGVRGFAISGGVAANSLLRRRAEAVSEKAGVPLYIPPRELCTDNGAMIAAAGYRRLQAGLADGTDLNAEAGLELVSWPRAREQV